MQFRKMNNIKVLNLEEHVTHSFFIQRGNDICKKFISETAGCLY